MISYKKYLKYKIKYLNLKNQIGYGPKNDTIVQNTDNINKFIINLMWINIKKKNTDKYIFPDKIERQSINYNYINQIKQWFDYGYTIYFWYNKDTVTEEQLKNTQEQFSGNKIEFIDINSILEDKKILTCDIYLQVDFLRLYILKCLMTNDKYDYIYYIYSDLLLKAKDHHQFIKEKNLEIFNFVVLKKKKGETAIYENGFICFKIDKKKELDLEIKNEYSNFISELQQIIIINNKLSDIEDCKKMKPGVNEYFFNIIFEIIILIQDIVFRKYNESHEKDKYNSCYHKDNKDNNYKYYNSIINPRNATTINPKNTTSKLLKYVSFFDNYIYNISNEKLIINNYQILKQKPKKYRPPRQLKQQEELKQQEQQDFIYVIPVIDFERPIATGKYKNKI